MWYTLLSKFLQRLGFTKTNADHNIFVFHNKSMFILVYVNDLLIIGRDLNIINGLKNKLSECFYITDLKLVSHYLSMSVTQQEIL